MSAVIRTLDVWLLTLGEEQPPETFYLDPAKRRGPLVPGDGSWHDASGYGHGCEVAVRLARGRFKDRFTAPWGVAAVAAQRSGAERTSLLPWEAP